MNKLGSILSNKRLGQAAAVSRVIGFHLASDLHKKYRKIPLVALRRGEFGPPTKLGHCPLSCYTHQTRFSRTGVWTSQLAASWYGRLPLTCRKRLATQKLTMYPQKQALLWTGRSGSITAIPLRIGPIFERMLPALLLLGKATFGRTKLFAPLLTCAIILISTPLPCILSQPC